MVGENIKPLVDELGRLKADAAELAKKERALKDQLIKLGVGAYDGDIFRATVSISDRETLDMEAVRAKLSRQFIVANTNVKAVPMVRVVARVKEPA